MKLGYACLNRSIGCNAGKTFRLASLNEAKLLATVENNLACLKKILEYNVKHGFMFFRISSDTVPFASHETFNFDWLSPHKDLLQDIGAFIKKHNMRISMHPGQYTVLNSPKEKTIAAAIRELSYHCDLLDTMELNDSAKIQVHVGGVYGDKPAAMKKFIKTYKTLPKKITRRLAIENDDVSYTFAECYQLYEEIGIPIIFDNFHHECLHDNEPLIEVIKKAATTWSDNDGKLMCDYSSQQPNAITGKHIDHIDINHFTQYVKETQSLDFDIILEIKDKELSALDALTVLKKIRP